MRIEVCTGALVMRVALVAVVSACAMAAAADSVPMHLRDFASPPAKLLSVRSAEKELFYVDSAGKLRLNEGVTREDLAAFIVEDGKYVRDHEARLSRERDECLARERRHGWRMSDVFEVPQLEARR